MTLRIVIVFGEMTGDKLGNLSRGIWRVLLPPPPLPPQSFLRSEADVRTRSQGRSIDRSAPSPTSPH